MCYYFSKSKLACSERKSIDADDRSAKEAAEDIMRKLEEETATAESADFTAKERPAA